MTILQEFHGAVLEVLDINQILVKVPVRRSCEDPDEILPNGSLHGDPEDALH